MSEETKSGLDMHRVLEELRTPFHPSRVTWKPGAIKGERALAFAYADLRAYMDRLDEVCGPEWSVTYEPWGDDRIICRLTIAGVTRSSTGESTNESERSEIGGTVAEAQAFKRACAMFGLGRYLYNLPTTWTDFDPNTKQFTDKAKAKLTNVLVQHYRRVTGEKVDSVNTAESYEERSNGADTGNAIQEETKPKASSTKTNGTVAAREVPSLYEQFNSLGQDLYGSQWREVCQRNVQRISGGKTDDSGELTADQIQKLISGMMKIKSKRQPEVAQN